MLYEQQYEMMMCEPQQPQPQLQWDHWDTARILSLGGTLASGFAACICTDPELKKTLGGLAVILGTAGAVVHANTPPRCSMCGERSKSNGTHWLCPCGHGITGVVVQLVAETAINSLLKSRTFLNPPNLT